MVRLKSGSRKNSKIFERSGWHATYRRQETNFVFALMKRHKEKRKSKTVSSLGQRSYSKQQARDAKYEVKVFAEMVGKKTRRLERQFKADNGTTPHDWLSGVRLADAKAKLAHGEKISTVATELGFSGVSQFSNWFLRKTGIRPSVFEKR